MCLDAWAMARERLPAKWIMRAARARTRRSPARPPLGLGGVFEGRIAGRQSTGASFALSFALTACGLDGNGSSPTCKFVRPAEIGKGAGVGEGKGLEGIRAVARHVEECAHVGGCIPGSAGHGVCARAPNPFDGISKFNDDVVWDKPEVDYTHGDSVGIGGRGHGRNQGNRQESGRKPSGFLSRLWSSGVFLHGSCLSPSGVARHLATVEGNDCSLRPYSVFLGAQGDSVCWFLGA